MERGRPRPHLPPLSLTPRFSEVDTLAKKHHPTVFNRFSQFLPPWTNNTSHPKAASPTTAPGSLFAPKGQLQPQPRATPSETNPHSYLEPERLDQSQSTSCVIQNTDPR